MFKNNNQKLHLILVTLFLLSCSDNGDSKEGCMDESSCNYDEQALIDDGSCAGPANTFLSVSGVPCVNCPNECGICNEDYTYRFSHILSLFNNLGCIGCHDSNSLNGSLDLTSYIGVMNLTTNSGGIINNCTDFENSILIQKIDGGSMSIHANSELNDAVSIWISEGAPE